MQKKSFRLSALLLAAVLLLSALIGCGKNDPSVLKLPDGTPAPDAAAQTTPAPLTPLGDRTCQVGQETIPESTLFSFILSEAIFDPLQGLLLRLSYTNKSPDRDFLVSLDYLSVNGYMQDALFSAPVAAGQTGTGEIRISANDLRSAGVSSVDELILYPLIYDDSVPMGTGDVVDGAFSFYPSGQTPGNIVYPVRQRTSEEATLFDTGFGSLVVLGAQADSEGLSVDCYLENKTDRFLSFSWTDVSVNGTALTTTDDTTVAPGMRRYATLLIPEEELSARGVTAPTEVAFRTTGTPLSNSDIQASPLFDQQGTYRFAAASAGYTEPNSDDEPAFVPDDAEVTEAETATPAPTTVIYTTPTSAQKKNAKNGYVKGDKVNMRSGPGTNYKTVGNKVDKNTAVTLYELQNGWWFLKCGSKYGYIKADYIAQGKAPKATEAPDKDGDGKTYDGTVNTQSVAALRQSADTDSKCIKELSDGTKLTVYYKTKGKDGRTWYYVSDGRHKGFIRSDLIKVTGKVPSK